MRTSNNFKVLFWLNAAKQKGEHAPIYARILINGKRAEVSLKKQTLVTYWDQIHKRTALDNHSEKELNTFLDRTQHELSLVYEGLCREYDLVTPAMVKNRFVGQDPEYRSLMELVRFHNSNMKGTLKPGTLKNYFTTEKYLKRFLLDHHRSGDIYLKQLNYGFILDFEQYLWNSPPLQGNNKLNHNGVMKHLERLKKLMGLAMDLEWLDRHPFARYRLKFHKHRSSFLDEFELDTLANGHLEKQGQCIVRDVFVFACYTGLSYSDVRKLRKANILRGIDGGKWIFTQREKNAQPVRIPLLGPAGEILERYKEFPSNEDGQLLPVYSNQKVNSYLKEITTELGIQKHLTFHSARHTFATTVTLSNGVPIETVSKMLGHTKITTTQGYARVLEQKISKDMQGLRNMLGT